MSGAFRLQPAAGRLDRAIHRPRLMEILQGRFEHRLTQVCAPAGAGKSTALALAVESNRLDPSGEDLWLGADSGDNDREVLLSGLCQAVGVTLGPLAEPSLDGVTEAVWRRAPNEVVLIIDDAHVITSAESIQLVSDLLAKLPANGHLLLAGRTPPAIPTTRIQAHGELLSVGAEHLELDDAEVLQLSDLHPGSGLGLSDLPRHAALADLYLAAGPDAQVSFLEEEVLRALSPSRLQLLARVSVVADFDDELVAAISSGMGDGSVARSAAGLVAGIPLVEETTDGNFRFHVLLGAALRERVKPGEAARVATFAAGVETKRGNLAYAVALLFEGGEPERAVSLGREFVKLPLLRRNFSDLYTVVQLISNHRPELALVALLENECRVAKASPGLKPQSINRTFENVANQARQEGDHVVEAIALFRAIAGHNDDASPVPDGLTERLGDLAETDASAMTWLRQVRCGEATKLGNVDVAFEWLDPDGRTLSPVELEFSATRLCDLGRPEMVGINTETHELLEMPPGAEVMVAFAMWLRGEVLPELANEIVADMTTEMISRGVAANSISLLGVATFVALAAGDNETAQRYLRDGEAIAGPVASTACQQFMSFGRAAVVAVLESDDSASEMLEELLDRVPITTWPSRHHLLSLSFVYVLRPETRSILDECEFGRSLVLSVQAGQALVAVRESGSPEQALALPWDEVALLRVQVLPHHLCELALAAMAAGSVAARHLLEQLPNLSNLLGRATETSNEQIRESAQRLLNRFPVEPKSNIRISTLGPVQLWRDGVEVDDDDWVRRRRVRELLGFLVEHRSVQRSEVALALWPGLTEEKAASNLRVNLSHLQKVLEPNRPSGSSTYYVQAEGERLMLHPESEINSDEFEKAMALALSHDRIGAASVAFDYYRAALEKYEGPYLADFDAVWCEDSRVRFDSLALGGYCRVGELTAARGEPEEALHWAMRALRVSGLSERAGRLFANCLVAMRDRAGAQQALLSLLTRLGQAGLSPEQETTQLLERVQS